MEILRWVGRAGGGGRLVSDHDCFGVVTITEAKWMYLRLIKENVQRNIQSKPTRSL